jgi:hypothetical protein
MTDLHGLSLRRHWLNYDDRMPVKKKMQVAVFSLGPYSI